MLITLLLKILKYCLVKVIIKFLFTSLKHCFICLNYSNLLF